MRITVMHQLAKGLRSRDDSTVAEEVLEEWDRLTWFLWHGNVEIAEVFQRSYPVLVVPAESATTVELGA